jgi:hypothetical protein
MMRCAPARWFPDDREARQTLERVLKVKLM